MNADAQSTLVPRRRRTRWLVWIAASFLLLGALGYFIVKPLAQRVLVGVGGLFGAVVQAIVVTVQTAFDMACQEVKRSPAVISQFGEPIQCAPFEQTQWIDTQGRDELEFRFQITGPQGTGQAHAIAAPTETGFELKSLRVTAPDGTVLELIVPNEPVENQVASGYLPNFNAPRFGAARK